MTSTTEADARDAMALARSFDLENIEPAFLADPHPTYHALRQYDPVHRLPGGSYFLTRYVDIEAVYRDRKTYRSDKRVDFKPKFGDSPLYEHHTTSLVFNDPPYHTRVRRLLAPFFTPRALKALQPRVEALVDRLLDRAEARGRIDLIADFATALPVELIGDMLGVPRDEREPLRNWSLAILGALEPVLSEAQFATGCRAVEEFKDYLRQLITHRRSNPREQDDGEILSTLLAAEAEGETLSELELLHNCIFLLNAGHETTTNLIGNGVEALFRFPGEMARLREHPELIISAVEEFLRFESSNQIGNRKLAEAVQLGGVQMPAGTYIHLGIGAANRDPAQFPDPDRLDIARAPNRHLAFGSGIHICAGMSLARMEGRVAIGKLIRRFPDLRLDGDPVRGNRARFRGFLELPAAF